MKILQFLSLVFISLMISASSPLPQIEEDLSSYCATWRSRSFNACEHEVRVDNGCYNRVHFRITVADGRYWDYYVNPGAWMTVPVAYCGQWYFKWL